MTLNKIRDEAFATAKEKGFHETHNFGETIALIHSELSEALDADREGKWSKDILEIMPDDIAMMAIDGRYEKFIRGTVEEELADAIIRICDLAGTYNIDLDWHVAAKMAYNKTRPRKHGKKY